jgi:hypothetical protein
VTPFPGGKKKQVATLMSQERVSLQRSFTAGQGQVVVQEEACAGRAVAA